MEFKHQNGVLHYQKFGSGPTILFIHGFYIDHQLFSKPIEKILDNNLNYCRVYLDLPKMGQSTWNSDNLTADQIITLLSEFKKEVIGNKPITIIANSYGAYLALGMTFQLQTEVEKLLLIAPVVPPNIYKRSVEKFKIPNNINPNYDIDFYQMNANHSQEVYETYVECVLPGVNLANRNAVFLTNFQKNFYAVSYNDKLVAHKFNQEIMVLVGDQDYVVGFQDQKYYFQNFINSKVILINDAGHNLHLDQFQTFNKLLESFLQGSEIEKRPQKEYN